tara:strand:- start:389 stop:784 length:396 start_codon:yes stop_codon:yes gene_type:complete
MQYNIDIDVNYENNNEYREALRKVFKMNCIEDINNKDLDSESRDELLYDSDAINNGMTFILNQTQDKEFFNVIYRIAASHMFSEDLGIGLSVLLAYDNFYLFHILLRDYFKDPFNYNEKNESYIKLLNHIK